jgi:rubrerythrin
MKLAELIEQYKDKQSELQRMVIISCVKCNEVFNEINFKCPVCGYDGKKKL